MVSSDGDFGGGARFPRHPAAGKKVRSKSTGQEGILTGVITSRSSCARGGRVMEVFVRPVGGGVEWSTGRDDIEVVG